MSRPRHFYKFCTAKVGKLNLSTGRLRFSSPLLFNDPFDCYFPPNLGDLPRYTASLGRRHHAIITGKENLPEGSLAAFHLAPLVGLVGAVPGGVVERSRKSYKNNAFALATQFDRTLRDNWQAILPRLRLLSLCGDYRNPLLWSHYSNCHRGVALEFEADFAEGIPFVTAKPVRYRKDVPRTFSQKELIEHALHLNSLPNIAQRSLPFLLTKSTEWRYEKEWRIVSMADEEDRSCFTDLAFSPLALSKIFLGCRISNADQKAIERLATTKFRRVEIYKARQSVKHFTLQFERIC